MSQETLELEAYASTDVGRQRDHNEDSYLCDSGLGLFVVADGMGGHAAGEVASRMATAEIQRVVKEGADVLKRYAASATSQAKQDVLALIEHAVQSACARIHQQAQANQEQRGMGTTTSALLIAGERGFIAHVGDSRVYLLRQGQIHQLTEDHSLANELIRRGKIKPGEFETSPYAKFKNAVTRAVGAYESVETDTFDFEVLPGDQFVLCSDGLHAYLKDGDLSEILAERFGDAPKTLVALANSGGGHDNITAVVARVPAAVSATQSARSLDLSNRVDVLRRMPLFRYLTYKELIRLLNVSAVRDYKTGAEVIREGQRGEDMFLILSGKIRLHKAGAVITHLSRGAHLGEMALVDQSPRSASATAEEDSRVLQISRKDFYEILRKEPVLATKLLWAFVQVLTERLRKTTEDLSGALEAVEVASVDLFEDGVSREVTRDTSRDTIPNIPITKR